MQRSGEYNRSAARLDFRNQYPGRVERLFREQGFPYQRVLNFRKAFREQKVDDLLKLKGIQKLDTMIPHLPFNRLRMQRFVEDTWGSKKYRFITEDGHVIESVFMPSKGEDSICISVQAGCRFGCTFCNTGKTGLKRRLLMPGSPMSLSQLQNVIMRYKKETNRYVSIVYCLFRNVNDSPEDADALIQFARGLPCKVNLLNYNEIKDSRYSATTVEGFEEFRTRLRAGGISVLHRKSLGTSIGAGCGQLGAVKQ